ncbi:beta-ketoacyl synthase N-terminal-like domain-containing protein [Amycolatopsis cihanbeyliensis]|uniref:3-oxoacyl-[acyl-carrier-protein] synthase II n=1 Tax=Amycolatopsis cihanbeyliensis TaxID=1128664 RepID=A0A542DE67_AMYCI|nr:beta-ketoacyl synthase N-terminal-like domain-containing protein [Amycolatopsis cihanbeyliensis]TQJ01360.1 3-oxoacyl-[acyl-carrier-protein] synthase II [Amycolatopsis cihanbeyliensis]
MSTEIVVTGMGVAVPGATSGKGVLEPAAAEPVNPAERIGKKGLRHKHRSTQLGLVAAYEALRESGLLVEADDPKSPVTRPEEVGVVAASNYGNLDSVSNAVDTIAEEGSTRLLSPVGTPDLSSNVIASEVAIRYALRGPNLSVCNGATSGLDTLRWAATWLGAGRARQVVVLAVEPDNEVVRGFLGGRNIVDGAIALVVETAGAAAQRSAVAQAGFGGYRRSGDIEGVVRGLRVEAEALAGWYGPEGRADAAALAKATRFELSESWGVCSSVLGLLQCAGAVARFRAGTSEPVLAVAGGAGDDASAGVLMSPAAS